MIRGLTIVNPGQNPGESLLVIGIGHEARGDDAVGLVVARKLKKMQLPGLAVAEAQGDGAALLARWDGAPAVVLVDAASSGAAPGTVHRFEAHKGPLPRQVLRPTSSHALSAAAAVELARALGKLPPRLIVYGIEGKTFAPGAALSQETLIAAAEVLSRVLDDWQEAGRAPGPPASSPGRPGLDQGGS
jgi:hydrogenase maturation protease